jgi:MFS family permease
VSSRGVLRIVFVSFAVAQFVSLLGDRLHQFSVVGMIGKVAPGSSVELFQFGVFSYLPILLFAPAIGRLVDRTNKVALIVIVDVLRGIIVLLVPMLYHLTGSLYAFYGTAFMLALANLLFAPAKSAIIPEIFAKEDLLRINAVLWGLGIAGTLGGFAVGGWLFDFHTWEWSFYTDGISYLVSVLFLLPLFAVGKLTRSPRVDTPKNGGATSIWKTAREGWALARRHRDISLALATQGAIWGAMGVLYVVGIAHVQEALPPGRTIYLSIVASAGTIGLLAGSAVTMWVGRYHEDSRVIAFALIVLAAAWIGIARSHTVVPLSAWTFVLGFSMSPAFVTTETTLQKRTPQEYRGRVFTLREVVSKVLFLLTSSIATVAATVFGKDLIILIVGVFLAGMGVLLGRKNFLDL